jgi:hypothetical protein
MTERSPIELDNLEFKKLNFREFCEGFQLMLLDMRSDEDLFDFQDYFEAESGNSLYLSGINELEVFGFFARYENFLQVEFGDGLGEVNLPDRIINVYQETEVLPDKTQTPWLWIGVFNENLNISEKKLLACKYAEDNSIYYWSLSETENSSPNNIPLEFRPIANKLRQTLNQGD